MMQFSTFDMFLPLPLPSGALPLFLDKVGLQPEPFQEWLLSVDAEWASSSRNWSDALRLYEQHRDAIFNYTG